MLQEKFTITSSDEASTRIDHLLTRKYPDYSRSFFTRLIQDGFVLINCIQCKKTGTKVSIGDFIEINRPQRKEMPLLHGNTLLDQAVTRLFEHEHFLILNKHAGLLIHQANQYDNVITLVDWLLNNYPELATIGYQGRPGIVHRLDRDTSGLVIIPKTTHAHTYFSNAFKNRTIIKEYIAVVMGTPEQSGTIEYPIGRDPYQKTKMKAFKMSRDKNIIKSRDARTAFFTQTYYQNAALLLVKPTTGRTHQIRVHLAAKGNPIIGDAVYGAPSLDINRHALHAQALTFEFQNQQFYFKAELPDDIKSLIKRLSEK